MRTVACPECTALADVPATLDIPEAGRLFACTRCSAIWRVFPAPSAAGDEMTQKVPETIVLAPNKTARARPIGYRAMRAFGLLLAVLASLGGIAVFGRHHLAVWMPGSRQAFLALGLNVKPSGLESTILGWRPMPDASLRVGYRVANPTVLSLAMPQVCVEGHGEDDELIFRRCFAPDIVNLPSGTLRDAEFLVLEAGVTVRTVVMRTSPPSP